MNNSNLIEVEQNLFNNLHSDFAKLFNTLHKYDFNIDTNIIMKLLELNNNINKLQLDINTIRIDLLKKSPNSLRRRCGMSARAMIPLVGFNGRPPSWDQCMHPLH